jgi:transcription elongation factor Elf1
VQKHRGSEKRGCFPSRVGQFAAVPMEVSQTIPCPFCGQRVELVVDTSVASQRFTTDCEICCRPFEIVVECEPGEVLTWQVTAG